MTSTVRILARDAKPGMFRVQGARNTRHRITEASTFLASGITDLRYGDGTSSLHFPDGAENTRTIEVELEETHPIAVLERMMARVEDQRRVAHHAYLEACRVPEDDGHAARRRGDVKLLEGKLWGLNQAITELRAGIEYYPGKA